MSSLQKFQRFCKDNMVLIVCLPLIGGIHWTWTRLQNVPELVDPAKKKDLPVIIGAKYLGRAAKEEYDVLTKGEKE